MSAESSAKKSEAMRGNQHTKGRVMPEEEKARRSAAEAGRKHPPDCGHCKGGWKNPRTPEWNAKTAASVKTAWTEGRQEGSLKGLRMSVIRQIPTFPERILRALLAEQWPEEVIEYEHVVGKYRIDAAIPRLKLAFEADGEYWHNKPGAKEYDAERDRWLSSQGWVVTHYSESTLRTVAKQQKLA